jgi:lysophospholipase L1-like esterase
LSFGFPKIGSLKNAAGIFSQKLFMNPIPFFLQKIILCMAGLVLASPLRAEEGPTPYPDKQDKSAWPGGGPIQVFEWMPKRRAAFWEQRKSDRGAVVFMGDSLTDGWGDRLKQEFSRMKVANRGIGGEVSRGILFRLQEDVLDLDPEAMVLCIGTNDLSARAEPAVIAQNIELILDKARQAKPEMPIVLCTVPPRDASKWPIDPSALKDLNARIVQLAAGKENLEVLDLVAVLATPDGQLKEACFSDDRLHLAGPGYEAWAEAIRPVFKKLKVR